MALEKGSPAYLAIDRGISFGDTIECPLGVDSRVRFRVTAIGEHHVLGRRCGFDRLGKGREPDYGEGPEELIGRAEIVGATRVG